MEPQTLAVTYRSYVDHVRPSDSMSTMVRLVCDLLARDVNVHQWSDLTTKRLIAWREIILARAKPQTWNTYRRHLQVLVNFALKIGHLSENPLTISGIPEPKVKPKTLNFQSMRAVIDYLESSDCSLQPYWFWLAVVRILYGTGIRRRQLLALRWTDVTDLDTANACILVAARGSKTRREWTIPLLPVCIEALRDIRHRTQEVAGPSRIFSEAQIFNINLWRQQSRYRRAEMDNGQLGSFFRKLNRALKHPQENHSAAIQHLSCHRFRHTFATEFARQGDLRTLQEILGHTNISTTMRYVHPDLDSMRQLMGKIRSI
jgi:integrase